MILLAIGIYFLKLIFVAKILRPSAPLTQRVWSIQCKQIYDVPLYYIIKGAVKMEQKRYLDYLLKLIRNEKHDIRKLSIDIEKYADEIADELEIIRSYNKDLTSDSIVDHRRIRIYIKMQRLLDVHQELCFKKQNIRNYKNEIFKLNNIFIIEWE
ncbi:hypothetical protein ACNRWW_02765 [Metabacillus sp. HB246100]